MHRIRETFAGRRIAKTACLLLVFLAAAGCAQKNARVARYDLSLDEQRGGHTLARHVARTDEELRERLEREQDISAASTWTDRKTAEETIAVALHEERGRIESWVRRGYPRANLALHFEAGHLVGRSLRRGQTEPRPCTAALIVLKAEGPVSFYVLTAYPEER
jgi:toxin YxiD